MISKEKRYVMIKPIMKDEAFLAIKSAPATKMDTQVAQDLKDTLRAHADKCVGMAANMIGVSKNIIIGSLTLTHSQNSQKSFRYGFFCVKFLFLYVVCVVILWYNKLKGWIFYETLL